MNPFKRHVCRACNRRFRKIEEMMQHSQVAHAESLTYHCNACNLVFQGMQEMRDHIRKSHSYKPKRRYNEGP